MDFFCFCHISDYSGTGEKAQAGREWMERKTRRGGTVHFCQSLTILRHSGPASDSERRAEIQRKCQNAKRFVPCLKKYIGKRLRLLTVALDTGSAVAALPCPV
jgi:hypothetical protein